MSGLRQDVLGLIRLFQESDLTELSVERAGRKLYLRKDEMTGLDTAAPDPAPPEPKTVEVKATMVGRFYWSKDKSEKSAVTLAQALAKGQPVGCIEALGIMNELEAPSAGKVVEIAAASGQPVEYDQTLIVLQPDE